MAAPAWMAAALLGCVRPDWVLDSKESGGPNTTDTGSDSLDSGTTTETDTGLPPDTGDTAETDSPTDSDTDTDTGTTEVSCDSALPWRFVAAGIYQTCGIHTDGCAECWGIGEEESSGSPRDTSSYYWKGEDKPPASAYESIVMFTTTTAADWRFHACGLTELGEALCWGDDKWGETEVTSGIYTDLGVWDDGTFSLDDAGTVGVWGRGLLPPAGTYDDIAVAVRYGLALSPDGTVETWDVDWEHEIEDLADKYVAVDLADDACGVRMDGTLRCWYPESPNDEWEGAISTDVPEGVYTDVCVSGNERACALDAAGVATCWGNTWADYAMQPPEGVVFTQIACGAWHFCGLTPEGEIKCWGYNFYGEGTPPS